MGKKNKNSDKEDRKFNFDGSDEDDQNFSDEEGFVDDITDEGKDSNLKISYATVTPFAPNSWDREKAGLVLGQSMGWSLSLGSSDYVSLFPLYVLNATVSQDLSNDS